MKFFQNKNPFAGIEGILRNHRKHWCPVSIFAYFRGKAFLGKPA